MMKEQTSSTATCAQHESLSALADGELQGVAFAEAMLYAGTEEGQGQWRLYHMIGEVMRSSEPVPLGTPMLLSRLRQQLDKEPHSPVLSKDAARTLLPVASLTEQDIEYPPVANTSVWRWKATAGCASLAAVAALGWNVHIGMMTAQVAQAPTPVVPTALAANNTDERHTYGSDETQVMLRNPRLDELLAAHQQFGSNTTVLQMPAGFLRNATFETPKTQRSTHKTGNQ